MDSKTHYCAACNSMETLLVHQDVCANFLPKLAAALAGKDHGQSRKNIPFKRIIPEIILRLIFLNSGLGFRVQARYLTSHGLLCLLRGALGPLERRMCVTRRTQSAGHICLRALLSQRRRRILTLNSCVTPWR